MKKILISSGPTRMPLDAMRFISNRSTGKFGTLLAEEALKKGAQVGFIYGKGSLTPKPHPRLLLMPVETNNDVEKILKVCIKKKRWDALIHAMALLDFQPEKVRKGKTKTADGHWNVKLIPTPKIISNIKKWDPKIFLVGFKLEIGVSQKKLLQEARRLIRQTKADLVLANQLTAGQDASHVGFLLDGAGRVIAKARGKTKLARLIVQLISNGVWHRQG